jgi:glycosyltransferase involved in cell wall biosynthesis
VGRADAASLAGSDVNNNVPNAGSELGTRRLRIAVVANTSWYLYNFRRNLVRALVAEGHEVTALGGGAHYGQRLTAEGFTHVPLHFSAVGTRPWQELRTVLSLRRALKAGRYDLALSYTPKANIYTAMARTGLGMLQVMNVSGLGRAFTSPGLVTPVVIALYRWTTLRADWVFFQNDDDRQLFLQRGLVPEQRQSLVPGSGVDLNRFAAQPLPCEGATSEGVTFLMIARLIKDKGVLEFIQAARAVRKDMPEARFLLLGPVDGSPAAQVDGAMVQSWREEGVVQIHGPVDDVRPFIRRADAVVLPSYREGVPRSLLEAAAMGRPVIATDVPGCRDVVDDGRTGLLCRVADAESLAEAMKTLARMSVAQRVAMGGAGREKVVGSFDERTVIAQYLATTNRLERQFIGLRRNPL